MTDQYEQYLIAAILLSQNPYKPQLFGVKEDWFTSSQWRFVWRGIVDCLNNHQTPDIVWLKKYTEQSGFKGCVDQVIEAVNHICHPDSEIMTAIEVMRKNYLRRQLQVNLTDAQRQLFTTDSVTLVDKIVHNLTELKKVNQPEPVADLDVEIEQRLEYLQAGKFVRTGFPTLDHALKGIGQPAFIVISGETSHGKTGFALNIIMHILDQNVKTCLLTTEMSKIQLIERLAIMISGHNTVHHLTVDEKQEYLDAVKYIQTLPVDVIETHSFPEIRMTIQQNQHQCYVIDYLQQLDDTTGRREYERLTSYVSELQNLSRDYQCTIIALSQYNRTKDDNRKYSLDRLHGSSQIEKSADLVVMVNYPYQDADPEKKRELEQQSKDNLIKVGIQKNRLHGSCGYFTILFNRKDLTMGELKNDAE